MRLARLALGHVVLVELHGVCLADGTVRLLRHGAVTSVRVPGPSRSLVERGHDAGETRPH